MALTNERRAAKAVFDQAKFQYSQSAIRAFQEVSDALIASQRLGALEEQPKREVPALTESVAIANKRHLGASPTTKRFWRLSSFSIQPSFPSPRHRAIGSLLLSNFIKRLAVAGALIMHNLRMAIDYFDKGIMAMIGRNAAVAEIGEQRREVRCAIAFAA